MDEVVDTVIVEILVPPEDNVRFTGLKETDSPVLEIDAVKLTVPANPLVLLRDILVLPAEPTLRDRVSGLADRVKPGCGGEFTVRAMVMKLTSEPLVPIIVIV